MVCGKHVYLYYPCLRMAAIQWQQSQIIGSQTDPFLISRRLISCWLRVWLSVRASMSSRHPPGPRASNMCWCAGLPFVEKNTWIRDWENLCRGVFLSLWRHILFFQINFHSFKRQYVLSTYRSLHCSLYGCFGHVLASALLQYLS